MSRNTHIKLVEGLCALVGIDDVHAVVRDGAVAVKGVTFSLIHDEEINPDLITVYADCGALPSRRELDVCMELMQSNLVLHPRGLPIFGISPVTRKVTLSAPLVLERMTSEMLRDLMEEWAARIKTWQKTLYTDVKPRTDARRRGFNWNESV